jgi:hypothetical protein
MEFTAAVTAIATAAFRHRGEDGLMVETPVYVELGILSVQEAITLGIRDPLYPPLSIRKACAEELFAMYTGMGRKNENFLPEFVELLSAGYEKGIGQKIEDLSRPLVYRREILQQVRTTSNSEGESQPDSTQQSQTQE